MACDENDSGGLWWTGGWSDLSILGAPQQSSFAAMHLQTTL
jgi:hypothetical protein